MMKRLIIVLVGLLVLSCADDDPIIDTQIRNIESYLTRTFGEDFDGYISEGVYRYIGGNALPQNDRGEPLKNGDRISIYLEECAFSSQPIHPSVYNNLDEEPLMLRIGDETLFLAVENAMRGCLRGDSVQIFITSDHAYGKNYFGSLPPNTPLMFKIEIQ